MTTRVPGWDWVARASALDGVPSREMFDELVAAGEDAVPLLVDVLSRPEWRDGSVPEMSGVPLAALRALGEIRSERALPALLGVLADPGDHAEAGQEASLALARHGEAAFGPVERMLCDRGRDPWARIRAARVFMYSALQDRRRRVRVHAIYDRFLRDPQERDKLVVSNVIDCACRMAMAALLPAIEDACLAGRADEDWGTLLDIQLDLATRRQRPDVETKLLARRDPREEHEPLSARLAGLEEDLRSRIEAELEAARAAPGEDGGGG